jgi:hypothetical protein
MSHSMKTIQSPFWSKTNKALILMGTAMIAFCLPTLAQTTGVQSGMTALDGQATIIKTTGRTICYSIAIIALLVGAVRVMSKVGGEIAGWLGAAAFFAVAGFVVDQFVGR